MEWYRCSESIQRKMINYGSFIVVKIVSVKRDFNDKTLTISSHVLVPMNADGVVVCVVYRQMSAYTVMYRKITS